MKMFEKAEEGIVPAAGERTADERRTGSEQVTAWLLDGRFFTIDPGGRITSWSPGAGETFGWKRADVVGSPFVETLLAPSEHPEQTAHIDELFAGGASGCAALTGDVAAVDSQDGSLRAVFAMVPIQLGIGYEFNALLQELATRSRSSGTLAELRKRHESVLCLIDDALSGKGAEAAQTDEGGRLAGALVVFEARPGDAPADQVDNVVSIADAAGLEEARAQLDRARRDAEDARVELRSLTGQLEEARREAQRARNEVDVARQEAGDARDSAALAGREIEGLRGQIDESRRRDAELRAQVESARIRTEDAQREADRLRAELQEARSEVHGGARDLGTVRAELEAARAAAVESQAMSERRGVELESLRATNERRGEELASLRAGAESLRSELERMESAFELAPVATALIAPDGRYIAVNAAFCALVGHPRELILSGDPPAIVYPDDADASRALARRVLAGQQRGARGYRRYLHAEGRALTTRESISLLRLGDGRAEMLLVQLEETHGGEDHIVIDAGLAVDEARASELVPAHDVPAPDAVSADTMRRALEDEMFELHCQPLLDLRTNEIDQYELLIRMIDPNGRRILPDAFLGPARRAGLSEAIDRWVVRRAIRLLAAADDGVTLEVNLSPAAVHDPGLPALIDEELGIVPVDPARLVLEVTGATAVEHLDETREMAKRLRGLGCRFALDDFRSTFGSFRILKDVPIDYLKLDGELVSSLSESRTSQLIVKALVDVAAGTGTKTVAVFVSDDETLALLRQQGVDFAQGYKVGRPRPVAELWPASVQGALPAPHDS